VCEPNSLLTQNAFVLKVNVVGQHGHLALRVGLLFIIPSFLEVLCGAARVFASV